MGRAGFEPAPSRSTTLALCQLSYRPPHESVRVTRAAVKTFNAPALPASHGGTHRRLRRENALMIMVLLCRLATRMSWLMAWASPSSALKLKPSSSGSSM